jgi:predicted ATP-binding protein involved in virulence
MWDIKKGLKLKKLYVENYKVLKDFEIDFCDEKGEPLPIIVLAGVNGCGKTAILESIAGIRKVNGLKLKTIIDNKERGFDSNSTGLAIGGDGIKGFWYNDEIKNKILYFSYQINLRHIKDFLPEYVQKLVFEYDVKASEVYKRIRENINDIFKDLNLNIEFDSRDGKGNLFFKHKLTNERFLIDELSSGEKTLVSEIMFLYLSNIKNMVILIDEPELSLHPTWQAKILKLYENYAKKNNCQIIIATHSPLILGSAKNEYLIILYFEDNKVKVLKNIFAYGRNVEWVLQEVMGLEYIRNQKISKEMDEIYQLIENNKLEEAEKEIDELEKVIGSNDSEILKLRNEIDFKRIEFEEDY